MVMLTPLWSWRALYIYGYHIQNCSTIILFMCKLCPLLRSCNGSEAPQKWQRCCIQGLCDLELTVLATVGICVIWDRATLSTAKTAEDPAFQHFFNGIGQEKMISFPDVLNVKLHTTALGLESCDGILRKSTTIFCSFSLTCCRRGVLSAYFTISTHFLPDLLLGNGHNPLLSKDHDRPQSLIQQRTLVLLGLIPVDMTAMLGCNLVMCLPDPRACKVMCASMYTLSFEVGVVDFVLTFKHIRI